MLLIPCLQNWLINEDKYLFINKYLLTNKLLILSTVNNILIAQKNCFIIINLTLLSTFSQPSIVYFINTYLYIRSNNYGSNNKKR